MKRALLTVLALLLIPLPGPVGAQGAAVDCEKNPQPPCINAAPVKNGPQPTQADIGPRARSENFWTGATDKDKFRISEAQLWYLTGTTTVALPLAPDVDLPDPGDNVFGGLSAAAFTGYKYIIHTALTIVGAVVFGLLFVAWLLEPALRLAESFQRTLIGPFELWQLAMAAVAGYFVWAMYVMRRPGLAIMELMGSGFAIALMTLFIPAQAIRYVLSLVSSAAAVVLVAGTGRNPANIPAPSSTASVDAGRLTAAYDKYVGSLEQMMIGNVAEVLTFGAELPPACQKAYEEGMAKGLTASSPENFAPFQNIKQCDPYVENAIHPDAERLFFAGALGLYALLFAITIGVLAWPALRGQLQLMVFAAVHKFAFLAAALPGPMRGGALRFLFGTVYGVFSLVLFALICAVMLLFMVAVWEASDGFAMWYRLLALIAVPVAMLVFSVKMHRRGRKATKETASKITRERTSSSKSNLDRASTRAQKALQVKTLTAATGGAGIAVAGVAAGAAGTKRFMAGDEESQGVFLGSKKKPGVEQADEPTQRGGSSGAGEMRTPARTGAKAPTKASIVERAKNGVLAEEAQRAYRGSAKTAGTVHRKMADTNARLQEKRMARQKPTTPVPTPTTPSASDTGFGEALRQARTGTTAPAEQAPVSHSAEPPRPFTEAIREARSQPVEESLPHGAAAVSTKMFPPKPVAPPPTTRTGSQK